jgi:hypothetical protein
MQTDQRIKKPVIAVVGEETAIKKRICQFYSELDFEVEKYLPEKIIFDEKKIYRVVLIINFLEETEWHNEKNLRILANAREKLLLVGFVCSKIKIIDDSISEIDQLSKNQYELLDNLFPTLSGAKVILGLNVLTNDKKITYPLKLLVEKINQKKIIDPNLSLFFQTETSFFKVLKKELVKPIEKKQYLVVGSKVKTTDLVETIINLYQKYFKKDLIRVEVLANESRRDNIILVRNTSQDLDKYFDKKIRSLPFFEKISFCKKEAGLKKPNHKSIGRAVHGFLDGSKAAEITRNDVQLVSNFKINKINIEKRLIDQSKISINEEAIDTDIKKMFKEKRGGENLSRLKSGVKNVKKVKEKTKKKTVLFYGGLSMLLIGGVGFLLFLVLTLTTFFAKQGLVATIDRSGEAGLWLKLLSFQANAYTKVLDEKFFKEQIAIVDYLEHSKEIAKLNSEARELSGKIMHNIFAKNARINDLLEQNDQIINAKIAVIKLLRQKSNGVNWLFLNNKNKLFDEYLSELEQQEKHALVMREFSQTLPTWLATNQDKSILIILQNDLELRSSGGTVEAGYLLSLKEGQIIDYEPVRVGEVDQNLPGEVISPKDLKLFLEQDIWSFKDSSWQVGADEAAKTTTWFASEATNRSIDGAIILNYSALQELLGLVGPLSIANEDSLINEQNLLKKVEIKASVADVFAQQVLRSFIFSLRTKSPDEFIYFLQKMRELLDEKQVIFYVKNNTDEDVLKKIGWSGEVVSPGCPSVISSESCFSDQIYQVDSNVGLNFINAYIARKISHRISLDSGKVHHQRQVYYHNSANSNNWPLGTYKNYIRFVLPKNITNEKILINNKEAHLEKLVNYFEGENKVIGVLIEVKMGEMISVQLDYDTSFEVIENQSYLFLNQKQPGTNEELVEIFINHDLKPKVIIPQAQIQGGVVGFSSNNNSHAIVGIKY